MSGWILSPIMFERNNLSYGKLFHIMIYETELRSVGLLLAGLSPAFIEADLRRIFEADSLADFAALWLLVHASRFGPPGTPPNACILERWRDAGQKAVRFKWALASQAAFGEPTIAPAIERFRAGVNRAAINPRIGAVEEKATAAIRAATTAAAKRAVVAAVVWPS